MASEERKETLVEKEVTYTLYKDGKFYIVENVPARVDVESGEQYFSPKTVENLHKIILGQQKPVRTIQTPVFSFA
jgi:YgiT-type zinc finger domain-containing protein